ncbi:MAG: TonB-dependent receptor [Candidatus Binatia bacterium]
MTAQRREENLQEVPIAITAFTQDVIEQRDIATVADLQGSTPGFVYAHVVGSAQPTLRGVGSDLYTVSGEPGVALYLDDIYLGRTFLPHSALLQIERIEVLRGPQGTLYGRNTSGGALKFVSKRPSDELEGMAGIQYGAFDQLLGEGTISGPIWSDRLKGRLSLFGEKHDGWTENLAGGEQDLDAHEVFSGRLALDAEPFSWLRLGLTADTSRQRDGSPVLHAFTPVIGTIPSDSAALPILAPYDAIIASLESQYGVVLDPLRERVLSRYLGGNHSDDPRKVYLDGPVRMDIESDGVAVDLRADLGFAEATLIGGYRNSSRFQRFDSDASDLPLVTFDPNQQEGEQLSGELHVTTDWELPGGLGTMRGLGGFFVYDEDANEDIEVELGVFAPSELGFIGDVIPPEIYPLFQDDGVSQLRFVGAQKTRSYAPFGEVDWSPFDWLTVRAGGRYTMDDKSVVTSIFTPIPGDGCQNRHFEKTFEAFTGRVGADWKIDGDRMLYASFSQGFKSGGFNNTGCDDPYDPEFVDAIEAGLKSEWLDRRLRVNLAGFFYDFDDIQVQRIEGLRAFIINAASAEVKGAELEAFALLYEGLSLDGNLAWLDAGYTEFFDDDPITQFEGPVDLSGNKLPKSPEWSGSVGLQYAHALLELGDATARVDWSYRDQIFFSHFNDPANGQDSFQLWNAFLEFEHSSGHGGVKAFVKNLADEDYKLGGVIASIIIGGPLGHYAAPRTWGVELYARF